MLTLRWSSGKSQGPPVVLLPGLQGSGSTLLPLARQLAPRWTVRVYDLPGGTLASATATLRPVLHDHPRGRSGHRGGLGLPPGREPAGVGGLHRSSPGSGARALGTAPRAPGPARPRACLPCNPATAPRARRGAARAGAAAQASRAPSTAWRGSGRAQSRAPVARCCGCTAKTTRSAPATHRTCRAGSPRSPAPPSPAGTVPSRPILTAWPRSWRPSGPVSSPRQRPLPEPGTRPMQVGCRIPLLPEPPWSSSFSPFP